VRILQSATTKRFLGCLAVGFVLALMWGTQEGNQNDYGYAFRKAVFAPRIILFLGIGVVLFLAIQYSSVIKPYLKRPGVRPLGIGVLTVLVSQTLMHWTDSSLTAVGNAKFSGVANAASNTSGLAPLAKAFFSYQLPWILLIVVAVLGLAGIILGMRVLAWASGVLAILMAIWAYYSHNQVQDFLVQNLGGGPDHSLGAWVELLGYLTIAAAGLTAALSKENIADTRLFVNRVLGWRPGFPLAVLGLVLGILALAMSTWFSPGNFNDTLADAHNRFQGTGLASVAVQYLIWLGWILLVVSAALALAATYLRSVALGWAAALVGVVAIVLTLITLYDISDVGAQAAVDGATGPWQNLGAGGWMACGAFLLMGGAGLVVSTMDGWRTSTARVKAVSSDKIGSGKDAPGNAKVLLFVIIAAALFYPPTATGFWQKVLVSEIGIYVLLAIGLNVVVGWAGLLDLGFIAFYAIGSYTTAFLTGALPGLQPPDWLHFSPLLAIPFAILICLLAGVALGAPTLRLRGDYLAIVTLGFGEIIRIIAVNNPGNITNGPKGAFGIPHPVVHVGPVKITWGQAQLQYWYLLLFLIVAVVILFHRLENSRLGRAWAAVREDEIAAQATGINTTRVKLLAFAIGASTSGVAGVFFASQIGYINPDNFVLNNSILVVAYVVFGGMGSLPGAMAGAAVLTWLPEFLKDQVPSEDRYMWIGAILLVMMIFRPEGLIPAKRRKAELHHLHGGSSSEVQAVPDGEGMGAMA
jgi:ABC-type branched-subunit amino acid transport system permease subunit